MRHLKILGLADGAVMALMAFAGASASATTLYSGNIEIGGCATSTFGVGSATFHTNTLASRFNERHLPENCCVVGYLHRYRTGQPAE